MPPRLLIPSLALGVGLVLTAGIAAAPVSALADTRTSAEGLLVFAIDDPGHNTEYWSVSGGRTPFGGDQYDELGDALDAASELDLSAFALDGRIKLKELDTCLGVQTATPTRPARAVAQRCNAADPNQEWRIDPDTDLLRNAGTGSFVQDTRSVQGWTLTDTPAAPFFRMMADYIDGRPPARPSLDADYLVATDTFRLTGKAQIPDAPVTVSLTGGAFVGEEVTTTDAQGAFSVLLPRKYGDREFVDVQVDGGSQKTVELRLPAVDDPRLVYDGDDLVLHGDGRPLMNVSVGTGPRAAEVIASGQANSNGVFAVTVPDVQAGDRIVVWLGLTGVRTTLTVPARQTGVEAVDGPDTELSRDRSTPVPIGLRAVAPVTRVTSTLSLTAPAGTVFTPGQTTVAGERTSSGTWGGTDARYALTDVQVSGDGTTLTAAFDVTLPDQLAVGDELRWWPTLDVVDPARAPASV